MAGQWLVLKPSVWPWLAKYSRNPNTEGVFPRVTWVFGDQVQGLVQMFKTVPRGRVWRPFLLEIPA